MKKKKSTWIVVADSASARFFALVENDAGRAMEPAAATLTSGIHRHASDLKSDKPGRAFASAGSVARSAVEPHHDYHKLEKHEFVRTLATFLEQAHDGKKFERLVLVAPDRTIGEMRSELSHKLRATVWREILKDLTKIGPEELWARLSPFLEEAPRPSEV